GGSEFGLCGGGVEGGEWGDGWGVGILGERAEAPAERGLIGMRHVLLAAKVDHLVSEERRLDLGKRGVADVRAVDVRDLCSHCGGERADVDVFGGHRRIVEVLVR